jgi:hypothetical protein
MTVGQIWTSKRRPTLHENQTEADGVRLSFYLIFDQQKYVDLSGGCFPKYEEIERFCKI